MPFINVNWESFNFSKSHCTPLTQRHFNDVKKIKITNWSELPCPSPGDLPNPGIKPRSPVLQADSLTTELSGKPSYCCFSSVTQLSPTLCDPMNRSMPGLPVHHQLPEFTQTHVH